MDGVDVALIETDGVDIAGFGATGGRAYSVAERQLLRDAVEEAAALTDRNRRTDILRDAEHLITEVHAETVEVFLEEQGLSREEVDVIGFHGQTVLHRPEAGLSIQLGDGQALASRLGIGVVYDFRAADMAAGGQGAPLVPAYHRALAQATGLLLPAAIVNIGGVANVTWLGADGGVQAFDTGPGNALIDDWVQRQTGESCDEDGRLANRGKPDSKRLEILLNHPFFLRKPPKSLDRNAFSLEAVAGLSPEDGAATLTAFTAAALVCAIAHFPQPPQLYVLAGGGARNGALRAALKKLLPGQLYAADELGWPGDALEAQAFAFLAVCALEGLPLTFPTTTGVAEPLPGGIFAEPEELLTEIIEDWISEK